MSEIIKQIAVTKGVVADYFMVESVVFSARCADLAKAVDNSRDEPILLWTMRYALSLQSDAVERFLARLAKLQEFPAVGQNLLNFGVDSTGVGFAALKPLEGSPLLSSVKSESPSRGAIAEAERRLVGCIRLIESVHALGVVCGDISPGSFWVDRAGDVAFIGLMGGIETDVEATSTVPSPEVAQYLAPEQVTGATLPASDVYALGVLAYYLFSGTFPERVASESDESVAIIPLSQVVQGVPRWADEVVAQCLEDDPSRRFANATELLKGISEARQRAMDQADLPMRKASQVSVPPGSGKGGPQGGKSIRSGSGSSMAQGRRVGVGAQEAPSKSEPEGSEGGDSLFKRMRLPIAVAAVFLLSAIVGAQLTSRSAGLGSEVAGESGGIVSDNPEMQRALDVAGSSEAELSAAAVRFEQLVASDDPLAHIILVKSAVEARSPQIRALAERSLVARIRRLGMLRSAEQLSQWLRTIASGTTPAAYEPLLKALNATLPLDAKTAELRKAYVADPRTTLRLAASIALDSPQISEYQALISQLVGDSLAIDSAVDRAALALIIAHPELAIVFGDDVVQRRAELPDADVLWLLGLLGQRNDYNVRAFASLALERGILTPLRQEYLAVVRDRQDVPPDVLNALVKGAAGAITAEDIGAIGRWFDREVERILLIICADVTEELLLVEAFDILAGKSLTIQPSAVLVDWVRRNAWENRAQFVRSIGILGNLGKVPDEEAKDAFKAFEPLLRDPRVVSVMLESNDPFITKLILERYSSSLGLGSLLGLLNSKDPEVRMLAISSLKGFNDVGALKLIIDAYDRETVEEVRQAYRENFWMIRERAEGQ